MRRYLSEEWDMLFDGGEFGGFEDRTYTDLEGNLITGLLENFRYYKKDDPNNWQYVENGKVSELPEEE